MKKTYLGDSVYVAYDGFSLILTTENGMGPTNTIVMESSVYNALVAYVDSVRAKPFVTEEES